MAWGRNELRKLSEDKAREEKEYKERYAGPIPEDVARKLGKCFFDKMTEELQRKVAEKAFIRGKGLFSSSYYVFFENYMLKYNDRPEDSHLFLSTYPFFPVNDFLSIHRGVYGDSDCHLYHKNLEHVKAVFDYVVWLCRENGLQAEYSIDRPYSSELRLVFYTRLPCDKNGVVK